MLDSAVHEAWVGASVEAEGQILVSCLWTVACVGTSPLHDQFAQCMLLCVYIFDVMSVVQCSLTAALSEVCLLVA